MLAGVPRIRDIKWEYLASKPPRSKMNRKELEKRLYALSFQQGHYGTINVTDVATMIELRDEKIKELEELTSHPRELGQ